MIEIKNLEFSYGNKLVLKNISLKLEAGKIYGLLGENGVGKTTLIRLLLALARPTEGRVMIGQDEQHATEVTHLHRCNFA